MAGVAPAPASFTPRSRAGRQLGWGPGQTSEGNLGGCGSSSRGLPASLCSPNVCNPPPMAAGHMTTQLSLGWLPCPHFFTWGDVCHFQTRRTRGPTQARDEPSLGRARRLRGYRAGDAERGPWSGTGRDPASVGSGQQGTPRAVRAPAPSAPAHCPPSPPPRSCAPRHRDGLPSLVPKRISNGFVIS